MSIKINKFIFVFLTFSLICYVNSVEEENYKNPLTICNIYTCPKGRGVCNEENFCVCKEGYDTIDDLSRGDFYCNYKKKSKLIAFLLEFVLGFGSGHFYMGHTILATIKMIFTTFTCLLFCQFNNIRKITEIKYIAVPMERVLIIGWAIWQIVDGILIGFNIYKDGNGYELR